MFRPGPNPQVEDPQTQRIIDLVWQHFEEIASELDFIVLPKTHVAPDKPGDGLTLYADGSDWDPGSGEGLYRWDGTSWVKI